MRFFFNVMAGGACGLFAVGLFWLAVEIDDAELQAGKCPHSGFTPDCPTPKVFEGFDRLSGSSRFEESKLAGDGCNRAPACD